MTWTSPNFKLYQEVILCLLLKVLTMSASQAQNNSLFHRRGARCWKLCSQSTFVQLITTDQQYKRLLHSNKVVIIYHVEQSFHLTLTSSFSWKTWYRQTINSKRHEGCIHKGAYKNVCTIEQLNIQLVHKNLTTTTILVSKPHCWHHLLWCHQWLRS